MLVNSMGIRAPYDRLKMFLWRLMAGVLQSREILAERMGLRGKKELCGLWRRNDYNFLEHLVLLFLDFQKLS